MLINGKRRHNSALVHVNGSVGRGTAGVDLNAIPVSAIERIEILRDGAAAQYGSDAIAGVINIVLKSSIDTTELSVSGGQTSSGDGEIMQLSANRGWRVGDRGYFNLAAEYRDRNPTNRAGPDPRQQYPLLPDGSLDSREQTFDRINHRYGDAEARDALLYANSAIGLGSDSEFYAFGGAALRRGESAGFYRRALDARNVPAIHPDGFLPLIKSDIVDLSLAAGYRRRFSGWALDASVTTGGNSFEFNVDNSLNVSFGADSPTSARAGTLKFNQTTLNIDVTGTVSGFRWPINIAIGAELRRDRYAIEAGELASYFDGGVADQYGGRAAPGIQVFPGFRPSNEVDESRSNAALYTEVEANPREKLLVALAARFERYSDFASQLSGKVAGRYELSERFALRASASTGFRAPSLHQAFFNNTSTQFIFNETSGELVPFEVGTFRNDSPITRTIGIPGLREETSLNFSAGFTARPIERLSITADVFKIDIDDRIVLSGQFQAETDSVGAPVAGPIRSSLEPFGVNAAQFFTNAIDTETRGADLVVAYVHPFGSAASLSLTGAANWNRTRVVGDVITPRPLVGLGTTLFNRIERERIERAQPRTLYNLAARFERQPFSAVARVNYFGEVTTVESATDPSIDQIFVAKWLTDVDVSYRLREDLRLAIGGHNVFDVLPDENRPEISVEGIFIYPRRTAPFGFNGGYYYTRLTYEF